MTPKNKKYIIVCSALVLVILAILTINSLIPRSFIHFETNPAQVVVMIDGKDKQIIKNGGTVTVAPGQHTVIVFRDDFNPYVKSVDLDNGQTANIVASLIGLTDGASKLLGVDTTGRVGEAAAAEEKDNTTVLLIKLHPILSLLPIESRNYTVSYTTSQKYPNNPLKIALYVKITDNDQKSLVYQNLKDLGYNPDSFEYVWDVLWDD